MLEDGLYDVIVRNMDIGDIVGLKGSLFFTKTGELTAVYKDYNACKKSQVIQNIKEKEGESYFTFEDKDLRYKSSFRF